MGKWIETGMEFINVQFIQRFFIDGPDENDEFLIKAKMSDGSEYLIAKAPDKNYEMGLLYIGKMLAVNSEDIIQTMRSDDDEIYDYKHVGVKYP